MMSLDLPVKTLVAIEKIIRGFLWAGRKEARGGHCLVAWERFCMPKRLGGLKIPNLRLMNHALRARWLWLSRTDSSKPWSEFNIQVPRVARGLFEVATTSVVGDGASTLFWTDRWLAGGRVKELAPNLLLKVPKRARCSRRVREGLAGGWLEDVPSDLNALEIGELLSLADNVANFVLTDGVVDELRWNWEGNHKYSARSAYRAFFEGKIGLDGAQQIWRSRAPNKCKFFLWLALKNRCWTADRLGRRGLPRPASCPLCDQEEEDIDHLLLGCALSREVWHSFLSKWGRADWVPSQDDHLMDWLPSKVSGENDEKDLWTAITLICWSLWRHRNGVVFEGHRPSVGSVIRMVEDEADLWRAARMFRGCLGPVDRWSVGE